MSVAVSIVIPCQNEEKYIGNCIDSFFKDTGELSIEILVMDGLSSDGTRKEIVKRQELYADSIRIIDNPAKKTPFALNLGIEHARGDYILIASAHSSFDSNYISEILKYFENTEADIIGGFMETKVLNETARSLSIIGVLSNKFGVGNSMFRVGVDKPTFVDTVPFGIYKTQLLKSIDGYDVRLIRNHDIEMSKRILELGYKILLVPSPKCYYYARETLFEIFKNNYRNGKWNLKTVYITKRFSSLSLRHFIPLFFLLSLLLPILISVIYLPFVILSVLSLLIYSMLVCIQAFKIKKVRKNTSIFDSILAFYVLHISYGIGSLVGLFSFNSLK